MLKNKKHRKNKKSWNSYRRWYLDNRTYEAYFNNIRVFPLVRWSEIIMDGLWEIKNEC